MRIAAIATMAIVALLAGAAQAQVLCWTTKEGKRACGDNPPPGAKTTAVGRTPADPSAAPPPPSTPAAPAAPKAGTKPAADADLKKQAEAQKASAKAQQAQEQAQAKQENCERARGALRALESGQRISRVGTDGERYFLDEAQVQQETAKAQEVVQKNCN